jgi:hypothetical protein
MTAQPLGNFFQVAGNGFGRTTILRAAQHFSFRRRTK